MLTEMQYEWAINHLVNQIKNSNKKYDYIFSIDQVGISISKRLGLPHFSEFCKPNGLFCDLGRNRCEHDCDVAVILWGDSRIPNYYVWEVPEFSLQ